MVIIIIIIVLGILELPLWDDYCKENKVSFFDHTVQNMMGIFECGTARAITPEEYCIEKGGTVKTQLCCNSVNDFPNTCLIGACGCSPDNSHEIKVCDCGEGKCYNETECINNQTP